MECKFMVLKWSFVMILLLIIVVGSMILQVSSGCVEDERMDLLDIKTFFLSFNNSTTFQDIRSNPFSSWVGPNCCNWERVICNSTSGGHVVELFLNYLLDDDDDSLLNVSLFQNFKQLKTLDLSGNGFSGFTGNQGFNQISNFNNLEALDLSHNSFGDKIFSSLGGITSLKKLVLVGNSLEGSINISGLLNLNELDLSWNYLNGTLQMQGLDGISRLEILNLERNGLTNNIFSSLRELASLKTLELQFNRMEGTLPMQDIAKLKNLEFLDLSNNEYYDGVIPLQDLRNLKVLNLSYNQFNSSLPIQGFCETTSLVELNIGINSIRGQFPECIGNFTSLKLLDVAHNKFSGKIPTTISNLTSIEYLFFQGNHFEGPFSMSLLANHSKLKSLILTGKGKVHVETEEPPKWHPTFQLEILYLRDCNLNSQTSSIIPTFLLSQHELMLISIADNQLVGNSPLWLLQNNSKLGYLDLSHNSFTGTFQLPTWKLQLIYFQISGNNFSGQLPKDMGLLLPELQYLNLSRNDLQGNLPLSMKQMKNLRRLDLSNNKFYGNLQISMFNNMSLLEALLLQDNNFSEIIEDEFKDNSVLFFLDISNNMISGNFPIWLGSLKYLGYVQMSNNLFTGELPREICSLGWLQFLDVSQNQLFGGVPSCFNSSSLVYLYMQENNFSGPIPLALLSTASSLRILDLSFNCFSGRIPNWFEKFTSLRILLLKNNKLQGPIPQQLCQVRAISIMDLSNNRFTGSIPLCLSNITFGAIEATLTFYYEMLIPSAIFSTNDIYFNELTSSIFVPLVRQGAANFTSKHRVESYKSYILDHMSGLDLSSNKLTGTIPRKIGDLIRIHALNFSHNKLIGPIPKEFSNLKQIESLDLSDNLLGGNIPIELGGIDSLSTFNVSYNNLSGMIPSLPKFSSYPESSYYGNPHLCGLYIQHKCAGSILPPSPQPVNLEEEVHGVFIDIETFFWSFGASYIVILLGFVAVLYINPQWRQTWFCFIEDCCYYVFKCIS